MSSTFDEKFTGLLITALKIAFNITIIEKGHSSLKSTIIIECFAQKSLNKNAVVSCLVPKRLLDRSVLTSWIAIKNGADRLRNILNVKFKVKSVIYDFTLDCGPDFFEESNF